MITLWNEWAGQWATVMSRVLIQGSLAVLFVWVLCRWSRLLPAAAKHWLWRLVYLKLAVLGLWHAPLQIPLLPASEKPAPVRVAPTESAFRTPHLWVSAPAQTTVGALKKARTTEISATPAVTTRPASLTAQFPVLKQVSPVAWLAVLWLLGVAYATCRFVRAWWHTHRLRTTSESLVGTATYDTYVTLCETLKLRRRPRLLAHPQVATPCVVGCLNPAIILPAGASSETVPQDTQLVLLHELTHVHRRDLWWGWLRVGVDALLFFNPLLWLARREWHLSQELACDETVVTRTDVPPAAYQQALITMIELGRRQKQTTQNLLAAGVHGSFRDMKERILAMNKLRNYSNRHRFAVALLIATIAIAGVLPYTLVAKSQDEPKSSDTNAFDHNHDHDDLFAAGDDTFGDAAADEAAEGGLGGDAFFDSDGDEPADGCDDADVAEASPVVQGLAAALKSPKAEVRKRVVEALTELKDPAAIPYLAQALKDKNSDVRHEALHGLEDFGDHRAVDAVAELLHSDNWKTRQQAIETLEDLHHPSAIDALVGGLHDPHHKNRIKVIKALEDHPLPVPVDVLTESLHDDHWQVRKEVVETFGELESPKLAEHLFEALKDHHPAVRKEAMESLEKLEIPHIAEEIHEHLAHAPDAFQRVRDEVLKRFGHHRDDNDHDNDHDHDHDYDHDQRHHEAEQRAREAEQRAAEAEWREHEAQERNRAARERTREARERAQRQQERALGRLREAERKVEEQVEARINRFNEGQIDPFADSEPPASPFHGRFDEINRDATIESIVESVLSQVDKKVEAAIARALKNLQRERRDEAPRGKSGDDPFADDPAAESSDETSPEDFFSDN